MRLHVYILVTHIEIVSTYILHHNPLEALKNKRINDVDVLIGHTNEETAIGIPLFEEKVLKHYNRYPELLVPRKILMKSTPEKILGISKRIHEYYFKGQPLKVESMREFVTYANHACFLYDVNRFVSRLPKVGNGRRYFYKFSCFSGRNVYASGGLKYGIQGAGHLDDLMYLFNANAHNLKVEQNTKEYELINFVCTVFTNFAKYGNPTPDSSLGTTWPEYNNSTKPYVEIGDTLTPKTNPEPEALAFWKSIFDYAGVEY